MQVLGILEEVGVPGEALWVRRPDLLLIPGLLRGFIFGRGIRKQVGMQTKGFIYSKVR